MARGALGRRSRDPPPHLGGGGRPIGGVHSVVDVVTFCKDASRPHPAMGGPPPSPPFQTRGARCDAIIERSGTEDLGGGRPIRTRVDFLSSCDDMTTFRRGAESYRSVKVKEVAANSLKFVFIFFPSPPWLLSRPRSIEPRHVAHCRHEHAFSRGGRERPIGGSPERRRAPPPNWLGCFVFLT